jgi:hypothetical protein
LIIKTLGASRESRQISVFPKHPVLYPLFSGIEWMLVADGCCVSSNDIK